MTLYSCDLCGREDASWAVIMRCEADCMDEATAARKGHLSPRLKPTSVRWQEFD